MKLLAALRAGAKSEVDVDKLVDEVLASHKEGMERGSILEPLTELWRFLSKDCDDEDDGEEEVDSDEDDGTCGRIAHHHKHDENGGCGGCGLPPKKVKELIDVLKQLIEGSYHQVVVKTMTAEILGSLSQAPSVRNVMHQKWVVKTLVEHLRSPLHHATSVEDRQNLHTSIIASLVNLTARHQLNQKQAIDAGVVDALVPLPSSNGANEDTLCLIWNLMPSLSQTQRRKVVPALHAVLLEGEDGESEESEDLCKVLAVGALSWVAIEEDTIQVVKASKGIKLFAQSLLMQMEPDDAKDMVEALRRYSEGPLRDEVHSACKDELLLKDLLGQILAQGKNKNKRLREQEGLISAPSQSALDVGNEPSTKGKRQR